MNKKADGPEVVLHSYLYPNPNNWLTCRLEVVILVPCLAAFLLYLLVACSMWGNSDCKSGSHKVTLTQG